MPTKKVAPKKAVKHTVAEKKRMANRIQAFKNIIDGKVPGMVFIADETKSGGGFDSLVCVRNVDHMDVVNAVGQAFNITPQELALIGVLHGIAGTKEGK